MARLGPFALWTYLGDGETWDDRQGQRWRNHKGEEVLYDGLVADPQVGERYLIRMQACMLGGWLDHPFAQTRRLSAEDNRRISEMFR